MTQYCVIPSNAYSHVIKNLKKHLKKTMRLCQMMQDVGSNSRKLRYSFGLQLDVCAYGAVWN